MNTRALVIELHGTVCRCGKTKRRRESFCGDCYFALPRPMRPALYLGVGFGYEEAYQAAVEHLGPVSE